MFGLVKELLLYFFVIAMTVIMNKSIIITPNIITVDLRMFFIE